MSELVKPVLDDYIFQQIEPLRAPLVDKFYAAQDYKIKCGRHERLFVLQHPDTSLIAAARLVPQQHGHYWLRNLVVAKEWRGQGLGCSLMQALLQQLESANCYCFALIHLKDFYRALQFVHLLPAQCPVDIASRYQSYRAAGRDWLLMGYLKAM